MVLQKKRNRLVDHVFQIRNSGWIRPEHLLKILGAQSELYSHRKNVDRFACIMPEEMGTQDVTALFFDDYLVVGMLLANPTRRGPNAHAAAVDVEADSRFLSLIPGHTDKCQRRLSEEYAWNAMVVGLLSVSVQDILG